MFLRSAIAVLALGCKADNREAHGVQVASPPRAVVHDAAVDATPPVAAPVRAAEVLEAARAMVPSRAVTHLRMEHVRADGTLDPVNGMLELGFGAEDGELRASGCARMTWEQGGWTLSPEACAVHELSLRCSAEAIWRRAIATGVPREGSAKLARLGDHWRFELVQAEAAPAITRTFEDDCAANAEAPEPVDGVVEGAEVEEGLPATLDRDAVMAAMSAVREQVRACATPTTPHGLVKVRLVIAPDGVPSVEVQSAKVPELGECVAAAVRTARFPRSQRGASVSYPFAF